ncbi:MAG: FtsX-like permease family protein [gamma proteobacterium symbiont of Taylorina sp.]|nr:FtsX-like permease family protein [gamma proteobacterium symbiont of Taylorina sp.]
MTALNHKLFRELWLIKGQVLAIALVIASGLSTVIMSYSTLASLQKTRIHYYQEYGFADLFVSLKRAPASLVERIKNIPGIIKVDQRIKAPIRINIKNINDSIQGQLVTLNSNNLKNSLNRVYISQGRLPEKNNFNEVMISEAFAEAHKIYPGDQISIIVNGQKTTLKIVGIALSPEYIYQIAPGSIIPDFSRYAIVWMQQKELEAVYDMQSSFNNLSIKLSENAKPDLIIKQLDNMLKAYGGLGSYKRERQVSHHFLSEEFKQLANMGSSFSIIFLGVSIFLLNLALGRIISSQRDIIATLKAFGYSDIMIAVHYSQLIFLVVMIGLIAGSLSGIFLAHKLAGLYGEYYRFPYLDYHFQTEVIIYSCIITLVCALSGSWFSINKALKLQPAEAMRPEVPTQYQVSFLETTGLKIFLCQADRMVLRYFSGHPIKSILSVCGTAFAVAIMIVGTFFIDAMDAMIETEFKISQREDLSISLLNPASRKVLYELESLSGVLKVEPYRTASVKMTAGSKQFHSSIVAYDKDNTLHRILDTKNRVIKIPDNGLLLTDFLAKKLAVKSGDWISIEFLQGTRQTKSVQIVGTTQQYIGVSGYMNIKTLNNLISEGSLVSGAYLSIENDSLKSVQSLLKQFPNVLAVVEKEAAIESFNKTVGEFMLIYISFVSVLSIIIAFGVIYNNARISLAERSRELASLRVLGYTKGEVAYILLGELALITLFAIPLGLFIGYWMSYGFILGLQQELFRIPFVINYSTYTLSILVVGFSAVISGLLVWYKLNRIDLVTVLKIKE